MKNKKFLLGLALTTLVGTASIFMTACGGSSNIESVAKDLDKTISTIEESSEFSEREIKIGDIQYKAITPVYADETISIFNSVILSELLYDVNNISIVYDSTFGYSFNCIKDCYNIIKNVEVSNNLNGEQNNSIAKLSDSIKNFNSLINQQEKDIKFTREYIEETSNLDLEYNAYYNYSQGYVPFVRAALNLANDAMRMVEKVYTNVDNIENVECKLDETVIATFKEKTILKNTEVVVKEVSSENYKVSYIDANNEIWEKVVSKFSVKKEGKISLGDVVKLQSDIGMTFAGKKIVKDTEVKIVNIKETSYTVNFVETNGIIWDKTFDKTGKETTESVSGEIKLNEVVKLKDDTVMAFRYRNIKDQKVNIESDEEDGYIVSYVDEKNFVWSAKVAKSFVSKEGENPIVVGDVVKLSNGNLNFTGRKFNENADLTITEVKETTYDIKIVDANNFVWTNNVPKAKVSKYEISYTNAMSLDVMDSYYSLIPEGIVKSPIETESDEEFQFMVSYRKWVSDYKSFMNKALNYSQEKIYSKKINNEMFFDLQYKEQIFNSQKEFGMKDLDSFDFQKFIYDNDCDINKYSAKEEATFVRVENFYNNIITNWTSYYFDILA